MNPTCWSPPIGVTTTMLDPYSSSRSSGLATRITGLDRSAARASADQPRRTAQTRARLDLLMTAAPFEVDGASVARECVAGISDRLHPSRAAAVVWEKKGRPHRSPTRGRREGTPDYCGRPWESDLIGTGSRPEVDDADAPLQQPLRAQLGIHLALAIRSEVLLAVVDHLLSALGEGAGSGLLFTLRVAERGDHDCRSFGRGRLVELRRPRRPEGSAKQQRSNRCPYSLT